MDTSQELEDLENITTCREVYNCLFDHLGPDHPGTIRAKYRLARELIHNDEENTEGRSLLMEVYKDFDDGKIPFNEDLDGIHLLYAAAMADMAVEDDEKKDAAAYIDSILQNKEWEFRLKDPSRNVLDYSSYSSMLVSLLEELGQWGEALDAQQRFISIMMDILHYDNDDMMDAVTEMAYIYSRLDDVTEEDIEDLRSYIDGILDIFDGDYMSISEYISELKEDMAEEEAEDEKDAFEQKMDIVKTCFEAYDTLRYGLGYALLCCEALPALYNEKYKEYMLEKLGMIKSNISQSIELLSDKHCDKDMLEKLRSGKEGYEDALLELENVARLGDDDNFAQQDLPKVFVTFSLFWLEDALKTKIAAAESIASMLAEDQLADAADVFDEALQATDDMGAL